MCMHVISDILSEILGLCGLFFCGPLWCHFFHCTNSMEHWLNIKWKLSKANAKHVTQNPKFYRLKYFFNGFQSSLFSNGMWTYFFKILFLHMGPLSYLCMGKVAPFLPLQYSHSDCPWGAYPFFLSCTNITFIILK